MKQKFQKLTLWKKIFMYAHTFRHAHVLHIYAFLIPDSLYLYLEFFLRIQCLSDLSEQLSSWSLGKHRQDCAVASVSVRTDALLTSRLIHILRAPAPCLESRGCLVLPVLLGQIHGMLDVWEIVYNGLWTSTSWGHFSNGWLTLQNTGNNIQYLWDYKISLNE